MNPPTYLVELFDPVSGVLEHADVFVDLGGAIESIHSRGKEGPCKEWKLAGLDVSFDGGVLEGISFFGPNSALLACLTVYHLSKDTARAESDAVKQMMTLQGDALREALHIHFTK